ncbi:hypothetical protein [Caproiciproducens sp. LBM24188]
MRKSTRILSLLFSLTLIVGLFSGTMAFAEETAPSSILFTDGFDSVKQVELNSIGHYNLELSQPDLTLTAESSNDAILSVHLFQDEEYPDEYELQMVAWKEGEATITLKASDNSVFTQNITVANTGAERTYTMTSDVTGDFSLPQGSSKIIKVNYNDVDHYSYPVLTTDDQENSLKTSLLAVDYKNGDYYYRVDAVGSVGQTGMLYLGSCDYIPDKLGTVTITQNKNLRLDTSSYTCNLYDTYRFVVYTNSTTPPVVSSFMDKLSVEYLGKVSGGYEYRLSADEEGDSLIQVTANGETATFPVTVNYNDPPMVTSDTPKAITINQNASYTYKFTIQGGGEPLVVTGDSSVATAQIVQKDGINYYCKVTALGQPDSTTPITVTFPDTGDESFNMEVGTVTVGKSAMTSDTNYDFSLKKGASYTFKITGATSFNPGSNGVFKTELVSKTSQYSLYKITAIGNPGQQAGFYMSAPGLAAQKVCVVTIAQPAPVVMTSDTNSNFSLKKGASYTFKITGATSFNPGSNGVFKTELVSKTSQYSLYKITAIGNPGQQAGFYMSAPGLATQKVCVVTIAQPAPVVMTSDTNSNFSLKKGASYTFKITGATSFNPGSSGVFKTELVSKTSQYSLYKITAIGNPGQQAGFYMSAPGVAAQKVCVVTVA